MSAGDVVIRAHQLGKRYVIGSAEPYRLLGERITSLFRPAKPASDTEEVWALRDVSFEVARGEVVGIVGGNGAGKSTLLKIVSRITEPTLGHVDIRGRVGSLLEVGTGFHLELTGRENLFMNAAILGMRRDEIRRRFDAIVAFAEVERFIDTPVKHYSTGMYMRLAFAVAAHLDPEILVVDEVLAVGDAAFQKKCLGKLDEVARQGRTVLFVAHNLGAIAQLCQTGLVLEKGALVFRGETGAAIHHYLSRAAAEEEARCAFPDDPARPLQVRSLAVRGADGVVRNRFDLAEPVVVEVEHAAHEIVRGMYVALTVHRHGTPVFTTLDTDAFPERGTGRQSGCVRDRVTIPAGFLKAGVYTLSAETGVTHQAMFERHAEVLTFQVEELREDASFSGWAENRPGVVRAPVRWQSAHAGLRDQV
jgi:lipopolysaccharide transport system ATP-binding protein